MNMYYSHCYTTGTTTLQVTLRTNGACLLFNTFLVGILLFAIVRHLYLFLNSFQISNQFDICFIQDQCGLQILDCFVETTSFAKGGCSSCQCLGSKRSMPGRPTSWNSTHWRVVVAATTLQVFQSQCTIIDCTLPISLN